LVIWEAIKWYARNGFMSLDFGRTEPENEGLLQFKRGWGIKEKTIKYYKYNFAKEAFVGDHHRPKTSYKFFKKVPSPLLNLIGSLLYKHVN
jgi:hypothetical protein